MRAQLLVLGIAAPIFLFAQPSVPSVLPACAKAPKPPRAGNEMVRAAAMIQVFIANSSPRQDHFCLVGDIGYALCSLSWHFFGPKMQIVDEANSEAKFA